VHEFVVILGGGVSGDQAVEFVVVFEPAGVRCERDYRALRVHGQLPPNLVGILLSIAQPLAEAGLAIFAISTYDTDYVLLKLQDLPAALNALRGAGHQVSG